MKTDIYLTVRLKSSRLPRKALAMVKHQSVIEHIIDRARHIKEADQLIICTSTNPEDDPLVEIAEKKGIPWFQGSEDNIVKRFLDTADKYGSDIGVRITGDNCLFSPEFVDHSIRMHKENKADYTSTKELAGGSRGDVFTINALRKLSEMLQDERASEYLSWLLAREDLFKVQWLEVEEAIKRPQYRLHCDTPQDLEFIRTVYDALHEPGSIVDYRTMIQYLDEHPEVVKINEQIQQVSQNMVQDKINFELKTTQS